MPGIRHRYLVEGSQDGKNWSILIDKSKSYKDTPNDYVELETPTKVRYVRYRNIEVPMTNLAISDIRVFGLGEGSAPKTVKNFKVDRASDPRDAMLTWDKQKEVQGYNVRWGIAPDKLYSSWMVYGKNELQLKCLNKDQKYYFSVQAFNENGVSSLTKPVQVN